MVNKHFSITVTTFAVLTLLLSGCSATEETQVQSGMELTAEQISTINSSVPSLDQVKQDRESSIRQRAAHHGFEVPDVTPRGVYTREESWRLRGDCMREYGYDVTDNPDGSRTVNFPEGQKIAFELSQLTCELTFPVDIKYEAPHTAEQRTIFYKYMVEEQIPCLENLGYQIDHKRIPSLQVFAENYWSDNHYSPITDIFNAKGDNWTEQDSINVEVTCPTWPPTEVLWPNS